MSHIGDTPWTLLDRDGAYEGLLQAIERHREEVAEFISSYNSGVHNEHPANHPIMRLINERLWSAAKRQA